MLHAQKDAVEVDRSLSPPIGERHVGHGHRDRDTRIVDEHVEPAEALFGLRDNGDPGLFAGHIVMQIDGIAARLLDRGHAIASRIVLHVGRDDGRPFSREQYRTGAPDSARRTRDQRDLALNPIHLFSPFYQSVMARQCGPPR